MLKSVKTNLFLFTLVMTPFLAISNEVTSQYIEKYKTIAISEMQRTGIPASIKLAQGILESNSGQSDLARQSNNHFGIKCGARWSGKEVYRHDDDFENGLLVRSCFRVYTDPYASFIAHSDFLANPHSKRYRSLFNLDQRDYKAWAHGLQKSGYATDKKYPHKLIRIIEKYELYRFDDLADYEAYYDEPVLAVVEERQTTKRNSRSNKTTIISPLPGLNNDFHRVLRDEQMEDIALQHNIRIRDLYFMNRMPYGSEPLSGEKLVLNKYLHFKKRPQFSEAGITKTGNTAKYLFEETITISSE